jgi:hypothetical protein
MAVKLEDVFDPQADGPPGRPVLQAEAGAPETPRALLLQMLGSLKTATAKEDLLRILRWAGFDDAPCQGEKCSGPHLT